MDDYTNRTSALQRAMSLFPVPPDKDHIILEYLDITCAPNSLGVIYYRPYFVAAHYLKTAPEWNMVANVNGASLTGWKDSIPEFLRMQEGLDHRFELQVPWNYRAIRDPILIPPTSFVVSNEVKF